MITKRDQQALDFLTEFKIAGIGALQSMFYPSRRVAQSRLSQLVALGELKRERGSVSVEYIYYYGKRPANIRHAVIASWYLSEFCKTHNVLKYWREPMLGSIRPDMAIGFVENGVEKVALVEIEISNKGLDMAKYRRFESLERRSLLPSKPQIIVVTDRPFVRPSDDYELVRI